MITSTNTSICEKNEFKGHVANDDEKNKENQVWPLLESRYGLNSMSLPNAKETDETSGCKYLQNETPEPTDYQETDLDGRLEKHSTCAIL